MDSSSPTYSQLVSSHTHPIEFLDLTILYTVPLATLVSATKPPKVSLKKDAILSPDGIKRYFVVHGGLFSKDEVTLEDIRKIPRFGKQPGQEGLMCEVCEQRF
jgi:serine/threonine-protein phosphatase 5